MCIRDRFIIVIITGFSILTILPFTQKRIYSFLESEAFYRVELLRNSRNYEGAIAILNPLIQFSDNPETQYIAAQKIAGIEADREQFKESIVRQLGLIELSPHDITEDQLIELHEAIYALGNQLGFAEAEKYLQELDQEYPNFDLNPFWLGATPTSPIWLGITPKNYLMITNGDIYQIGVESAEEFVTLKTLVENNPNDPPRRRAAGYQVVIPESPKGLSGI